MTHAKLLPMIVTDDLTAARRFYVDSLGWTSVADDEHYQQFRAGDDAAAPELAFAHPMPDGPLGRQPSYTQGLVVSIPVDDADRHRDTLRRRGVDAPTATDKPWGWRSFVVRDPSGVTLDFFHPIAEDAAQDAAS